MFKSFFLVYLLEYMSKKFLSDHFGNLIKILFTLNEKHQGKHRMHILAVSNHEVIEIVECQSLLLNNVLAKCGPESRKNLNY